MIIFAVDDEPSALKLLCRAIREAEPEAEICDFESSSKAIAAAQQGKVPDIAFMDIDMPGMSGMELAAALRKNSCGDGRYQQRA